MPPPPPPSVSVLHVTGFECIFHEQSTVIESGFVLMGVFSTSTFGLDRYTPSICIIPFRPHTSYTQPHTVVVYYVTFFSLFV